MNNRLRSTRHDLCKSCGRYAFDTDSRYCMSCGYAESSPIWGALLMVTLGFAVLAVIGFAAKWLAS